MHGMSKLFNSWSTCDAEDKIGGFILFVQTQWYGKEQSWEADSRWTSQQILNLPWTPESHYHVYFNPALVPLLSVMKLPHILSTLIFNVQFVPFSLPICIAKWPVWHNSKKQTKGCSLMEYEYTVVALTASCIHFIQNKADIKIQNTFNGVPFVINCSKERLRYGKQELCN